MKRGKGSYSKARRAAPVAQRLDVGQKVRDRRNGQIGEVLDFACQYAHPKADPVYNYLVRWADGQVQAIAEGALLGDQGLEVLD